VPVVRGSWANRVQKTATLSLSPFVTLSKPM